MKPANLMTSVFLLPLIGLLTGCGGGGGSGSSSTSTVTSLVKWSAFTPPGTVVASGYSANADYTEAAPFQISGIGGQSYDTGASSAEITYRSDSTISKFKITTPNGTFTWDEAAGDTIDETNPEIVGVANSVPNSFAILVDALALGWEYQTLGAWQTGLGTGSGTIGSISVGAPTPGAGIPTTGTAVFAGNVQGIHVDSAGAQYYVVGDVVVATDFAARAMSLATTNTSTISIPGIVTTPAPSLELSGSMTYAPATNSFAGAMSSAGGMVGTTRGQFYGPNAEEVGGVFIVQTPAGQANPEYYQGAYGAVR